MQDEEKGFEFVDKRASREAPEPEQQEEHQAEEPTAAAEEAQAQEEGAAGDVYSLIGWMIAMLTESAWQWMGLHKNPITNQIQRDLAQAKVAIDSVVFLADQISPHVPEEQRRAFRTLISDLRINFVQQGQASAGSEPTTHS